MSQFNSMDSNFYTKKDSTELPLKVKLHDNDCSTAFDLTGYTGKFYMSDEDDYTDVKVDGSAVTVTSAEDGEAQYNWVAADVDTIGRYRYEFEFTKAGKSFRIPVYSPGIVVITEKIG